MQSYVIFIKILVDTLAISSDSEDLSYYECQATGKEPESECSDCEVGAFGHAESLSGSYYIYAMFFIFDK